MKCKNCDNNYKIVNKHYQLCVQCNNIRLHGNKYGKAKKQTSQYAIAGARQTGKHISLILADEQFYEECFNVCKKHECEECGGKLPKIFKHGGKVIARYRYSHIIPKSIAPHLRHKINNINQLCFGCHQIWDFGNKKEMKIYKKNKKRFPNYLK